MTSIERFLKAVRFEDVDRPPVWMMRQAGRTLPEYRSLREKHSFWELCRTPELAAEVTLQPLNRFQLDAAVIFSDILVVPAALGMKVSFSPRLEISPAISDFEGIERLNVDDICQRLDYVAAVVKRVFKDTNGKTAVLGFSGAPFTLSSYMIEGGSSRHFIKVREMMYGDTSNFMTLQEKLTHVISEYLILQAEASATAVQLFDTWAGELSPRDFETFVQPFVQQIIQTVKKKTDIPIIYYVNGIGSHLSSAASSGADVLGVDWRISLSEVRRRLGERAVVQGNLDPAVLFAPQEEIRRRVNDLLHETGGQGHIVNLGHGLIPETHLSGIETFIKSVIEWRK
ncbi:MAG: uroporphyrinogen decarboxylase [Acidobacteria bacterium]|nr:uroporphyrinogen decarboxylase [Acidobacteriota bacterium]MBU1475729.1 uroporphyrinogen decarboxylase [Acidobacteriota bacterium]MBU4495287.1 uroporphyrinogen decarboxylase [Acidobacteriota bacterium]MCG2816432.1 uroporphyrinogen decarboxylase [Candidatus Aminicenantes bacterium]